MMAVKITRAKLLSVWAKADERIVALHQENQGKASALNHGLLVAKGEYVACIDGDAVLDFDAIDYMVQSLELNRTYGAVTGNPRVRNRSTILGRLQVSEFSSIIGLNQTRSKPDGNHLHGIWSMLPIRKDVWKKLVVGAPI